MGDLKYARKHGTGTDEGRVVSGNNSSGVQCCLKGTIWTLTLLAVVGAFVLMNYLQYDQILRLKSRVEFLEDNALILKESLADSQKVRRDLDASISITTDAVKELIRDEIKIEKAKGFLKVDVAGNTGCGETRMSRQLPVGQTCCNSLSKPMYFGNSTEIVTTYIGQEVLLPCNVTGYPPPRVTFNPAIDPSGQNRYVQTAGGLLIRGVQNSDGHTYTCTVENVFGKQNKVIQLRVTDPVVATTSPSSITVNEGDKIQIRCDVSGSPPPVVAWEHQRPDGVTVPVIAIGQTVIAGNTITINNAHASNSGSYICRAQNQFEKDQASTVVKVIAKPEIIQPPRTQTVLKGSTVTLYCSVVANPPATVTWTYPLTGDRAPLNAYKNPDNSITLSNVDHFNSGSYKCTATNNMGTVYAQSNLVVEKKTTASVTPHLQPMTGSEPILNFQCTADGLPKPTATWSKVGAAPLSGNSKYLALAGGNLIISGPSLATDTGIFECFAANRNGNATDRTIVYRDLGQIKCSDTFASLGCEMQQTCGGVCPSNCAFQGQSIYGYMTYSSDSAICMAATHSGSIPNPSNNPVIWTHLSSGFFTGLTTNGLNSQSHAPGDANKIIIPSTGSIRGGPLIG